MEIEDKYIKLLGKYIYNKELDKFGRISSLELVYVFGLWIQFNVFYDTFDSKGILFLQDFLDGKSKFVIINDESNHEYKQFFEKQLDDIKSAFENKFLTDMLIYMSNDEWKEKLIEQNKRNVQKLHTDLVFLTDIAEEVLSNDFYSRELYLKFNNGILSETQLLYALVNHIAQEYKRIDNRNNQYFFKYEFIKEIKNTCCEK